MRLSKHLLFQAQPSVSNASIQRQEACKTQLTVACPDTAVLLSAQVDPAGSRPDFNPRPQGRTEIGIALLEGGGTAGYKGCISAYFLY